MERGCAIESEDSAGRGRSIPLDESKGRARRGELGAAVCIYFRGKVVKDLWGGYRDRAARAPWARDTCWASTRAPLSS